MRLGFFETIAHDLGGNKGRFRLILQPAMAIFLGIRLGMADARAGHPPFLMRLFRTDANRMQVFKMSLREAIIPLTLALVLDGIIQFLTLGWVRPLAAVVVGAILVWIPFVVTRALTCRVAMHQGHGGSAHVH
jgi:hypothetical protein